MPPKPPRADLLSPDTATPAVWGLALAAVILWIVLHFLSRRFAIHGVVKTGAFFVRVLAGSVALWLFWQAVARHLALTTSWSLWTSAIIGAVALEVVIALYQLERRIVSRRVGRWLLGLRLLASAAVLTILVQPVFARDLTEKKDRNVVVLIDHSASMQIADKDRPVEEKLAIAQAGGMELFLGRPELVSLLASAQPLVAELEKIIVEFKSGDSGEDSKDRIQTRQADLYGLHKRVIEWSAAAEKALNEGRPEMSALPGDLKNLAGELKNQFTGRLRNAANELKQGIDRKDSRQLRQNAQETAGILSQGIDRAEPVLEAVDQKFYESLPEDSRGKIDAASNQTRSALAENILTRKKEGKTLLDRISETYTLRFMHFGKTPSESDTLAGAPGGEAFRSRTDLTSALARIRETYSDNSLAGVVALSDFRHNGPLPPENPARELGSQGSPICPILTGSRRGSKDAAIIDLNHAQSIFLGDRVRLKADIKADGLRGKELVVKLRRDGQVLQEEKIKVPEDGFRTTVRLSHQPAEKGIARYTVSIDPLEGELFANNNEWNCDVAVSDDRTNVLIIEDRPRWEFRYLRNLFYGRDKSVHLQYVLLHPDTLPGAPPPPDLPASAARKFGDCEANRLPASVAEWRKFDVIIIGDVPPAILGEDAWRTIHDAVEQRGAMLIVIAGENAMPHAYTGSAIRSLLPVEFDPVLTPLDPSEAAYRLTPTADGRSSSIFHQSDSTMENSRIWDEIPAMRWRHPVKSIKPGAEVLAWAQKVPLDPSGNEIRGPLPGLTGDPATILKRQRELEQKNAVMVTSRTGLGKVALMLTDQSWRFRYGIGDAIHHRFWGQLIRWGAGENLPTGTGSVRMGTDKLTTEPGGKVTVSARLTDEELRPVIDADVSVNIYLGKERVLKRKLEFNEGSNGMYQTEIESLTTPGDYRMELSGPEVDRLLARENSGPVSQTFTVTTTGNPVELGEVSVDPEMATRLASISGGTVATPGHEEDILKLFGPASREITVRKETSLWDNWIMLLIAVAAMTAEWILRRRSGLA